MALEAYEQAVMSRAESVHAFCAQGALQLSSTGTVIPDPDICIQKPSIQKDSYVQP